ncbi:hypothetical protein EON71_00335 [bacterium]|nr:MAG: hypothetical protein EON71_00335 [bacterium]
MFTNTNNFLDENGDVIYQHYKKSYDDSNNMKIDISDKKRKNPESYSPQEKALEYSRSHEKLPIFGIHRKSAAGRSWFEYICTTYENLYKVIKNNTPENNNFCEIVMEGVACKFYVDAECYRLYNKLVQPGSAYEFDMDRLSQETIINYMIKNVKGITKDDISISVTDASNDDKFSRHYVVNIKKGFFATNTIFKHMIRDIIDDLPSDSPLYVMNKDRKMCFFDEAVYTKNRLFRIMGCTKHRDNRNLYYVDNDGKKIYEINEDQFFDSLICYSSESTRQILETVKKYDINPRINALRTYHPSNKSVFDIKSDISVFNLSDIVNFSHIHQLIRHVSKILCSKVFPGVDTYTSIPIITDHLNEHFHQNVVSSACPILKRRHKSNHVGMTVYFRKFGISFYFKFKLSHIYIY